MRMAVVSSLISHTRKTINLDIKLVTYCHSSKTFVLFTNKHSLWLGFWNWPLRGSLLIYLWTCDSEHTFYDNRFFFLINHCSLFFVRLIYLFYFCLQLIDLLRYKVNMFWRGCDCYQTSLRSLPHFVIIKPSLFEHIYVLYYCRLWGGNM
jgi:hypothetical protein